MTISSIQDDYQFNANERILFIGDSITDAGRTDYLPPFGDGFVFMVVNCLKAKLPHLNLQFQNQGISGNTIEDLQFRWKEDVLAQKPDWLFIKIGINDTFQNFNGPGDQLKEVKQFNRIYHDLLLASRADQNPKIVLLTPFYAESHSEDPILKLAEQYIETVKAVGRHFRLPVLDLHQKFQEGLMSKPPEYWTTDKVHPYSHGHTLIALTILEFLGIKF